MKKIFAILLSIVVVCSLAVTAAAAVPQADDMENYIGNPGMFVTQEDNGIHVKIDANEGGTFTTAWGYNIEQVMDGLTITMEDLKLDSAQESGICLALGNYEGAYWDDRCLMFVLNASLDGGSWVFCGKGNVHDVSGEVIPMVGTSLYGLNDGMDVTFKWERKDDDTWVWKINDQEFEFADSVVQEAIDDEEFMFVTFGGWGAVTNAEYTLTGVGSEEDLQNNAAEATEPTETTESDTTPETTPDTTTPNTTPAPGADSGSDGNLLQILIIVAVALVVLLLGAIGLLIYVLAIKRKKSA